MSEKKTLNEPSEETSDDFFNVTSFNFLYHLICSLQISGRNSVKITTSLQNEAAYYNDIVVFDFQDTYRNLTIKTLTSLHWAVNTFNTSYIFKVDDDIFPYVGDLLKLLNRTNKSGNFLMGDCENNTKVNRNPDSKVYVSYHDYQDATWPAICFGTAYVISSLAVRHLLAVTNETRLYHMEDVSLGLLARKSKDTQLLDVGRWKSEQTGSEQTGSEGTGSEQTGSEQTGSEQTGSEKTESRNRCPRTYTYHSVDPVTMETIWRRCVMNSSSTAMIYTEDELIKKTGQ